MHLVVGMSNFNLKRFNQSLSAFKDAQQLKESAKTAKQWYSYVEREKNNHVNLAMLNN